MSNEQQERTVLSGRVVFEDGILEDGIVVIEGERIAYAGSPLAEYVEGAKCVKADGYIWPGLIDVHIHGAGGADVMDATPQAIHNIAETVAQFGVTGFLPTTVTGDKPQLEKAMANVVAEAPTIADGAEILGIHLEGPWICPQRSGAQNPDHIVDPAPEDAAWAVEKSSHMLRIVTMAPERPGALATIRELAKRGVNVSIGHTDATYDQVLEAIEAGAAHVTHCFNAMSGLHHREPGVVGAALTEDRLTVELIADGFHVHPAAVKLVTTAKGTDGTMLITDGMRAVGMPAGEYDLGGLRVFSDGETARLENGSLAGSLLTLDAAVRKTTAYSGMPLYKVVHMASLTPAKRLGVATEMGSIRAGKLANLVVVDEACRVERVFRRGKVIHQRTQ